MSDNQDFAAFCDQPLSIFGGILLPALALAAIVGGAALLWPSIKSKLGGGVSLTPPPSPPGSLAAVLSELSPKLQALESSLAALGVDDYSIAKQSEAFVSSETSLYLLKLTNKPSKADAGKAVQS